MDLAKLRIAIDSRDIETAARELDRLSQAAAGTEKQAERTSKATGLLDQSIAGVSLRSIAGGAALAAFMKSSVNAAMQARNAFAQVEQALTTMGGASGKTAQQLQESAQQLANISNFGRSDILGKVTAQLLTFGNISGQVFDRAQKAALDLSARLGQDLQSSAIQLGKALNDPIQGITALSRVGVSFNDSQKETIKAMVEAGRVAEAQGVILQELERQYSGAAQAARDAAPGGDITQAWRELREAIGEQLIPALKELERIFVPIVQAVANNLDAIKVVIGGLASGLAAYIVVVKAAAVATAAKTGTLGLYIAAISSATRFVGLHAGAQIALTGAVGVATSALRSMLLVLATNPFTAAAVVVGILAAQFINLKNAQAEARAETERLRASLVDLANQQSASFQGQLALVKQSRSQNLAALREQERIVEQIRAGEQVLIRDTRGRLMTQGQAYATANRQAAQLRETIIQQNQTVMESERAWNEASQRASEYNQAQASVSQSVQSNTRAVSELEKEQERLNKQTEDYIASLGREIERLTLSAKALRELEVSRALDNAQTEQQRQAIIRLSDARERELSLIVRREEQKRAIAIIAEEANARARANQEIGSTIRQLEMEVEMIGASREQRELAALALEEEAFIARYKLTLGLDEARRAWDAYREARERVIKGESAFERDLREIERLSQNLQTAAGMVGGSGGRFLQGLMNLEVKFKNGETGKLADRLANEFPKLSKLIGDAVQGAVLGQLAGNAILGGKGSSTGSAIGGALGQMAGSAFGPVGGVLGSIAGGLVGGLVGGLFKKTPQAAATVAIQSGQALMAGVSGSSKLQQVATGLANGLIDGLGNIAQILGGEIGGAMRISIGQRKDQFTVDPTGMGRTKGVPTFATEAEAVAYAMRLAISQGAITGISAGAQRLIQTGSDLQAQLNKALAFDDVFRQLARAKDPLAASLADLATEFTKLTAIFREAGASAADYAALEELFTIRRERAIFEASRQRRELEIQLMAALGDEAGALAAKRELELEAMDESLRALQSQVWAAEDAARAQREYRQQLERTSNALVNEINRLRGVSGVRTTSALQSEFAMQTAMARAGNLDALGALPGLSQAIEASVMQTASSALEVARIRAWLDRSLSDTLAATGGNFASGAPIFDGNVQASQTTAKETQEEIKSMREDLKAAMYQIAKTNQQTYNVLDRWDGDGLPPERFAVGA